MDKHLEMNEIIHLAMLSEQHEHLSKCAWCKDQYDDLHEFHKKNVHSTGPVKLCGGCGRFMPVDENRKLIPHKKFLSDILCTNQDTAGESA